MRKSSFHPLPFALHPLPLLFVLLAALLIGQRFDATWAGGTGYERLRTGIVVALEGEVHASAGETTRILDVGDTVKNSEIIRTENSMILLDFDGTRVGLDERTDLILRRLSTREMLFSQPRGRAYYSSDRPMTIQTSTLFSRVSEGILSVVHYDFRDEVDVLPLNTLVSVTDALGQRYEGTASVTLSTQERAPANINAPVDFSTGAGKTFYEWVETKW